MEPALPDIARELRKGWSRLVEGRPRLLTVQIDLNGDAGLLVTVSRSGRQWAVPVSPAMLNEARVTHAHPAQLIAAAMTARSPDEFWLPARAAEFDLRAILQQERERYERTSADIPIERNLSHGRDILLEGGPGTGKSATAAAHANAFRQQGKGVVWIDMAATEAGPQTLYEQFLTAPDHPDFLVVVDGMQANIPRLEAVFAAADELRDGFEVPLVILATGPVTLVQRAPALFRKFRHESAKPAEIVKALVDRQLPEPMRAPIQRLADNDPVIARMAIGYAMEYRAVPTRESLAAQHVEPVTSQAEQDALFWFAALTFVQIEVSEEAAKDRFSRDVLSTLTENRLLVLANGRYSAGPRSRAALVLSHAMRHWRDASDRPPAELAWEYLSMAGEGTIRAVLDRLGLIGGDGATGAATEYLLPTWELARLLERYLEKLCAKDPTWQNDTGAAIFAGMALARMRRDEAWTEVANFVREQWVYNSVTQLPQLANPDRMTADYDDFPRIQREMAAEEHELDEPPVWANEQADKINLDQFHRNWMLGMLLCFEGSAVREDRDRIERLHQIAEYEQMPLGFFYPGRVPWVTARVVLGLCATGLTYETSETIRRACDWLLHPAGAQSRGAFDGGWWRSGTGSWNRQEATTAMCLAALLAADVPVVYRPKMAAAMAFLWTPEARRNWSQEKHEIDLALVIDATLRDAERWRDAYSLIGNQLLPWAIRAHGDDSRGEPANDVEEARLRLPFVTYELMTFVWHLVDREFSTVLGEAMKQFAVTDDAQPQADTARCLRAVEEIEDEIKRQLRHRDDHLRDGTPGPAMQRTIDGLRDDLRRLCEIRDVLQAGRGRQTVDEIDRLGRRYLRNSWMDLLK